MNYVVSDEQSNFLERQSFGWCNITS